LKKKRENPNGPGEKLHSSKGIGGVRDIPWGGKVYVSEKKIPPPARERPEPGAGQVAGRLPGGGKKKKILVQTKIYNVG